MVVVIPGNGTLVVPEMAAGRKRSAVAIIVGIIRGWFAVDAMLLGMGGDTLNLFIISSLAIPRAMFVFLAMAQPRVCVIASSLVPLCPARLMGS